MPYLLGAAGSACLAAAGAGALAGDEVVLRVPGLLGPAHPRPGRPTRSPACSWSSASARRSPSRIALASWAAGPDRPRRRGLGASYALALGGVAVVLTARDVFTLLFAWETVTLAFYLLSGFERARAGRPAAALVTLAFGRVSGAALLAGLLLLASRSGSLSLAGLARVPPGTLRSVAEVLLLAGFVVKVGLVPFQVWLPRGYAAAPGPARAIMAGVAVNIGFYGLWRTLALLGPPPAAVTGVLLVLAGLTAVLGIAHAAVQTSLQRVIAYSSVENSGLILAGFGVALVGSATHDQDLLAVGLLAATLQVVAHTLAKSLLFTASAPMTGPGGSDDLDELRGMARRRPWSAAGLAIGSLTLAGLPPTAGFVSEWFLLEALMQQFRVPGLGDRLVLAVTGAAVALTAGFAGVTFVRLVGLVVLGRPGPGDGVHADYGRSGRVALVLLGAGCLAVAALTPLEIRVIAAGPGAGGAGQRDHERAEITAGPPAGLRGLLHPVAVLAVDRHAQPARAGRPGHLGPSGRRMLRVRRVPPWRSATAGVSGRASYTAFGFANPTRRVLAAVLHTRAGTGPIERGPDRPDAHVGYRSDIIEIVEEYLYRPLRSPFRRLVRAAQRLQSGRLDAYLAYMLIALIAVLAVVTALH